jgi:alcohol dehydrogenase, propanol-preferring
MASATYRAIEVTVPRNFKAVDRELRDPGPNEVRIRVLSCGVCHSDMVAVDGPRPDPDRPVVPGHEIVGIIDAVGSGVSMWRPGERVGVGYLGGHCGVCEQCRRGRFVSCTDQPATGSDVDGGYAEYVYARASGVVRVPEELAPIDASPLLCAGLTTYKAVLRTAARPGTLIAVQGIGGLGHLGLQYAAKLGYRVAAIARGADKADLAVQLGADYYINSEAENPAAALQQLGGAAGIIATATSGASMSPLVDGLAPGAMMVVVGVTLDPIPVSTFSLVFGGTHAVVGSLTGSSIENEDSLALALAHDIRPMTEVMALDDAPKAYERMMSGDARFRVVLEVGR